MLSLPNWAKVVGAAASALLLVGLLSSAFGLTGQICDQGSEQNHSHCASYNLLPYLLWSLTQIFNFVSPAITAFATIAIACFTLTLKRSTDKMWEAGERQYKLTLDTFTKLERPYLYVFGADKLEADFQKYMFDCFVKYRVANLGKLPATIRRARIELAMSDTGDPAGYPEGPAHPSDTTEIFANPVFAASDSREFKAVGDKDKIPHDVTTSGEAIPKIEELCASLFLWIVIEYDGPFTRGHETSACWRISDLTNRFQQHGGADLNYVR